MGGNLHITKGKRKFSTFSFLSLIPLSETNPCLLADLPLPVTDTYGGSFLWLYIISIWEACKKSSLNTDALLGPYFSLFLILSSKFSCQDFGYHFFYETPKPVLQS